MMETCQVPSAIHPGLIGWPARGSVLKEQHLELVSGATIYHSNTLLSRIFNTQ